MQRMGFSSLSQPSRRAIAVAFACASIALAAAVPAARAQAPNSSSGVVAKNVSTIQFFSQALNENRAVSVILPLDYQTSTRRYPVLYLLHGYTGNNTDWSLKTNLSAYAARYRLIIIMPDGSNGWYVNSASDPKQKFEDYIIKDLMAYVESHYRTIPLRRARAIAGLSMGGYGAMFLGLKHWELFAAVGSFSGALGVAHGLLPPLGPKATARERANIAEIMSHFGPAHSEASRERDPFDLAAKIPIQDMPMLYIAEGGEDFLIKGNHEFVATLASLKIPYEYREVSPRVHSWDFWDEQIQVFLRKLAHVPGFGSGEAPRPVFPSNFRFAR